MRSEIGFLKIIVGYQKVGPLKKKKTENQGIKDQKQLHGTQPTQASHIGTILVYWPGGFNRILSQQFNYMIGLFLLYLSWSSLSYEMCLGLNEMLR